MGASPDSSIERERAIPRIIHQIWYQGAAAVPARYRDFAATWRRLHPAWEYRLWDHAACRRLMAERYPDYLALWDSYPLDIQRIDSIRYFILHSHGGVYLDMDMECLRPIDSLLEGCDFLLSRTIHFNNAVMGSSPGHALWDRLFPSLRASARTYARPRGVLGRLTGDGRYIVQTAGPALFSRAIAEAKLDRQPGTLVCPHHIFEPYSPVMLDGRITLSQDTSRSYAIHHEAAGWMSRGLRIIYLFDKAVFRLRTLLARGRRERRGPGVTADRTCPDRDPGPRTR